MEGLRGQGPVSDRDAPADRTPDRRAGPAHGVHRELAVQAARPLPPGGPGRARAAVAAARRSPTRIADLYEDEIVALRKELTDDGFDAGADTIHYHLAQRHGDVPSVSTIWRVLRARGFVTPQPHKRPEELLGPLRGRAAQRVLAGRHHPCARWPTARSSRC